MYFVDLCGICLSFILYMCLDCELYCVIHFVIHIHTTWYYFEIDLLYRYIYIYTHTYVFILQNYHVYIIYDISNMYIIYHLF